MFGLLKWFNKQLSVIKRREERRRDSVAYPELARTSDEHEYGTATIGMHALNPTKIPRRSHSTRSSWESHLAAISRRTSFPTRVTTRTRTLFVPHRHSPVKDRPASESSTQVVGRRDSRTNCGNNRRFGPRSPLHYYVVSDSGCVAAVAVDPSPVREEWKEGSVALAPCNR